MLLSRRWPIAKEAAAIVILVVLAANQWRLFLRFHYHDFMHAQSDGVEQSHRKKSHKAIEVAYEHREDDSNNPEVVLVNEIIHRAFFGLGHRLHRSAAAYHLARSLSLPHPMKNNPVASDGDHSLLQPTITHFRFHWESCLSSDDVSHSSHADQKQEDEKEYNVFRYLFGDDVWKLNNHDIGFRASTNLFMTPKDKSDKNSIHITKHQQILKRNMLVLRNDIPGYIAGQLYKDLQLPVKYNSNRPFSNNSQTKHFKPTTTAFSNPRHQYDVILDKVMLSDVKFYQRLVDNFRFKSEIEEFQKKHRWNERPLVLGLHLRAGNGEDEHFLESGRASSLDPDDSVMIARLVRLVKMMAVPVGKRAWEEKEDSGKHWRNYEQTSVLSPLLFIATDTAHLLPLIEKEMNFLSVENQTDSDDHLRLSSSKVHRPNATTTHPSKVSFEIVTWPQYRLPKNAGVTFDTLQGKGESCLEGWRSSMSDMLLLSNVDILVAAKRSTFTQSLPLALGFDRNRQRNDNNDHETAPSIVKENDGSDKTTSQSRKSVIIDGVRKFSYCEVSEPDMIHATCYSNMRAWLFRGEDDEIDSSEKREDDVDKSKKNKTIWRFSLPRSISGVLDRNQTSQQTDHKVTVLLPDVVPPNEFEQAREFLRRENTVELNMVTRGNYTYESVFRYGKSKIERKYRNAHKVISKTNSSWNLIFSE